ncbi:hypothetical protein IGK47_003252 [Enterococcus sp. AZ007]
MICFLSDEGIMNSIIACIYIMLGLINIISIYKRTGMLFNPLSIFSMVWLILIPITSFQMPILPQMTIFQWEIISIANIFFCLGGLLISIRFMGRSDKGPNNGKIFELSRIQFIFLLSTLIICVAIYLIQAVIAGGFPAMADNPDMARRTFYLPNMASLSNLGMMPIYIIFKDRKNRKNKLYLMFAAIYFIELYMMAVRFGVMMLVIMIASLFSSKSINVKQLKYILLVTVIFFFIFVVIANVRGGNINNISYFTGIGAYSGSDFLLRNTEILRYIGYSQRLMENYFTILKPGSNQWGYTLSPILEMLDQPFEKVQHLTIWGYTATNIISYLFLDFGKMWPLVYGCWSGILHIIYYTSIKSNSIIRSYLWTICFIGLVLSFYAYVHSYIVWLTLFLLYALFVNFLGKISISRERKGNKNEYLYN